MTKVFISYSRKDKLFAEKFSEGLNESDLETWIDWVDIPATADWLDQIHKGIEQSDAFLFLLSPDSIVSKICTQEVDHAIQNAKRLIPIVLRDVEADKVHPALAKVNWIYCREHDDFDDAIEKTVSAIRTDLAWVEFHRRLQIRALEWQKRSDPSLLLRGRDLREAEEQLASVGQKDPQPSDLQRQYTLAGRRGESRTRNLILVIGVVILFALSLLSIFANNQRILARNSEETAIANANLASTEKVNAQNNANLASTEKVNAQNHEATAIANADLALARQLAAQSQLLAAGSGLRMVQSSLLAIESLERYPTLEGDQALKRNWLLFPRTVSTIRLASFPSNPVSQIAFSPDGNFLASGGTDGAGQVWDIRTGQKVSRMRHKESVTDITFSPDGRLVASCAGNAIVVWDASTGKERAGMLHADQVQSIDFSPDGKSLLSASSDGTARVWDVRTGQEISHMEHAGIIWDARFSPDGKSVVSGGNDNAIAWDPATGDEIARMNPAARVFRVAFSPDGRYVASAGEEISRVWDAMTGEELTNARQPGNVLAIAFSPYGDWVASGSTDGTLMIWEATTGIEIARSQHDWTAGTDAAMGMINAIDFSPNGSFVLTGSIDGSARLWDARTGTEITRIAADAYYGAQDVIDAFVNTVAFSPDGKLAALGNSEGLIRIWNVDTDMDVMSVDRGDGASSSIAFRPDGKELAYGGSDGAVHLWDMGSGSEMDSLPARDGNVLTVAFSRDGERIFSISDGRIARIWDRAAMREIASIPYNNEVALSPDGQWVAYDGEDNIISVRDVTARSESTGITTGHPIYSLIVSPDGKWIAAAGTDGEEEHVSVWEVATGRKTSDVRHSGYIIRLTFSPNGNWVVSGSEDGTVRIWEPGNGSVVASVNHDSPVYSVAFSSDGRYMASGSGQYYIGYVEDSDYFPHGTMAIWDTFTQKEIARIPYDDPIDALVFSPDGKWILNNLGYISNVSTGMDVGRIGHGYGAVFSPDGKWIVTNSGRFLDFWLWRPEELVADLCSRLPRNLTRAEWNFYIGKEPYRATCTNLPIESEVVPTPSQ